MMNKRYIVAVVAAVFALTTGLVNLNAGKKAGSVSVTRQQIISDLERLFRDADISNSEWDSKVKKQIAALRKSARGIAEIYQRRYDVVTGKVTVAPVTSYQEEPVVTSHQNEEPTTNSKATSMSKKRGKRAGKTALAGAARQRVMSRLQQLLAHSELSERAWHEDVQIQINALRNGNPDIAAAYQRWYDFLNQ